MRGAGGLVVPAEDAGGGLDGVGMGARDEEAKPSPSKGRAGLAGVGVERGREGKARRAALRDVIDVCLVSTGGHVGSALHPKHEKPCTPSTKCLSPQTQTALHPKHEKFFTPDTKNSSPQIRKALHPQHEKPFTPNTKSLSPQT